MYQTLRPASPPQVGGQAGPSRQPSNWRELRTLAGGVLVAKQPDPLTVVITDARLGQYGIVLDRGWSVAVDRRSGSSPLTGKRS